MRASNLPAVLLAACCACAPAPVPPPPAPPPLPPPAPISPAPAFHMVLVESPEWFLGFATDLGVARMTVLLKLNRIDEAHVRVGDSLVVPSDIGDELTHAPLPRTVSSLAEVPRLIAVSKRIQAFGVYEAGALVRWGPTSTGRPDTPTPAGLYAVNWKARQARSTDNAAWLLKWLVNFHSARGISFHEYDLPGYPASHACVRLLPADAEWVYGWVEQWRVSRDGKHVLASGTPVLVFGEYDFDAAIPPWKRLSDDPAAALVPLAELEAALAPHLETIRRRATERDSLRSLTLPP